MNASRSPLASSRALLATALLTATAGLPLQARAVDYVVPDFPLQTGAGNVPPNIMYVLDDSGSMSFEYMQNSDLADVCRRQTNGSCFGSAAGNYVTLNAPVGNTLTYVPSTDYLPWVDQNGDAMTLGRSFNSAYGDFHLASGTRIDLADPDSCGSFTRNGSNREVCGGTQTFLVPKDPTNTTLAYLRDTINYWRYQIRTVDGVTRIVRSELVNGGGNGSVPAAPTYTINNDRGTLDANTSITYSIRLDDGWLQAATFWNGTWPNEGNVRLRIYAPTRDPYGNGQLICDSNTNNGLNEACAVYGQGSGLYRFTLTAANDGVNVRNVRLSVQSGGNGCRTAPAGTFSWGNCTYANPTGRSTAQELANYATWFSYHRTRMKVAKGGSTRAFSALGDGVRVGFRTIHNRNTYDIPVGDANGGVFSGTPRATWFSRIVGAAGSGGTPLRAALQGVGEYYSDVASTGPYGPGTGEGQLACRQNFTILTTDGFWNGAYDNFAGDQDSVQGDAIFNPRDNTTEVRYTPADPFRDGPAAGNNYSNALSDIAMYYWKNDLRTDLDNLVPTTGANPAFWQHMVTFGVSIGLKGTLDQQSVAEVMRDGRPRRNGVAVAWPNPTDSENAERIDDLLHAAVNGHGEFIAATDAARFAEQLAGLLGQIQSRLAAGSNVAVNSTSFQSDTRAYQALYQTGQWTGDLVARDVTAAGGIATAEAWRTSTAIENTYADADTANDYHNRTILTWSGSGAATFPTPGQLATFERTDIVSPVSAADNAAWLKGSRANERSNGGTLRNRTGLLGDIVNSSPFYLRDNESIFIGSNDGMLHAINALTGAVRYSYVPAGVNFSDATRPRMADLSNPGYTHGFFVDGPVAVSSERVQPGINYLVGTLGRGGRGAYALNVTGTDGLSAGDVLWDHTADTDADMGFVYGLPVIVKANNGLPVALVPNGVNSTNGSAVLYVYNVATGAELARIDTGAAGANGLSSPRAVDLNGDSKVDYVFAGDLQGNLWKFDLSSTNPADWEVALSGQPLFTAVDGGGSRQPITGGVAVARERVNAPLHISFGTGRLMEVADMTDTSTQSVYTIIDTGTAVSDRSELTERGILETGADANGRALRAFEAYAALPTGSRGWVLDLGVPTPGERVVSGTRINGRALFFSSVIPQAGDDCESSGRGYLNAIDVFTGTSPSGSGTGGSSSFFDLDGDGSGDNDTVGSGLVGSIDLGVGMPTESSQIDNLVIVCGSGGVCADTGLAPPPGGAGAPRRLSWRELFNEE